MTVMDVRAETTVKEPEVEAPKKIQKLRGIEAWEIGNEMPQGAIYVFAAGAWRHVSEALTYQTGNIMVRAEGEPADSGRYAIIKRADFFEDFELV